MNKLLSVIKLVNFVVELFSLNDNITVLGTILPSFRFFIDYMGGKHIFCGVYRSDIFVLFTRLSVIITVTKTTKNGRVLCNKCGEQIKFTFKSDKLIIYCILFIFFGEVVFDLNFDEILVVAI